MNEPWVRKDCIRNRTLSANLFRILQPVDEVLQAVNEINVDALDIIRYFTMQRRLGFFPDVFLLITSLFLFLLFIEFFGQNVGDMFDLDIGCLFIKPAADLHHAGRAADSDHFRLAVFDICDFLA